MEFLDPEKERRHQLMLFVGYALIALAIGFASLILLYWSYGYSVDRKGDVGQSGLVFVSSQPSGATISLNGEDSKAQTGAKLNLKSGTYIIKLSSPGYAAWQHPVTVRGGDVQRFDYPMLFPTKLSTDTLRVLKSQPLFLSQSPDRRWVVWMNQAEPGTFRLYDLKDPTQPVLTETTLPAATFTASIGPQNWADIEWSSDNRHLLLKHEYTTASGQESEYVMLDRANPGSSQNLTPLLALQPTETLSLFDQKPDRFYAYNSQTKVLRSFTATAPLDIQLSNVRAYKTYGNNTVLYVTDTPPGGSPVTGKVSAVLQQGDRTTVLRQFNDTQATYLLDIAEYGSTWYIVAGSSDEGGVYVYKDPQTRNTSATTAPPAWRFLRVKNPNFVAFSSNARFIMAENGQNVAVYDAENVQSFVYTLSHPLDAPQTHVLWKDGHRLTYVSNGKLIITEFDNYNTRILQSASPAFAPLFSGNNQYSFTAVQSAAAWQLTTTPYVVK